MKKLTNQEKYIVKKLAEWDILFKNGNSSHVLLPFIAFIAEIRAKYTCDFILEKNDNGNVSAISFYHHDPDSDPVSRNEVAREFIDLINFLDYLCKNDYINTAMFNLLPQEFFEAPEYDSIGFKIGSIPVHKNIIRDPHIIERCLFYYHKDFYPSESLVNYYKSNYKTPEELRFEQSNHLSEISIKHGTQNMFLSKKSYKLALILGLITIIIALLQLVFSLETSK